MTQTHHKTCNLCEACCGLLVEVEDGRVRRIRPDPDDPLSRGHICPKAVALREIQEDPDRLTAPVRRIGGPSHPSWQPISWEEAFDEVTSRLVEVQQRHGADAVGTYLGNPTAHNFGAIMYVSLIHQAIGTRNRYSASSLDQNPKHASSLFLFGHILAIPVPDIDHTDFLLVLGANPVISGGSLMTAPGFRRRLEALKQRGGKLVVVDPRRSETADLADQHLSVPPGSDALLLASLAFVLFDEKKIRDSPAKRLADGAEQLEQALAPFSPEQVGPLIGLSADSLRRLARDFAAAPTAACYGRLGTCANPYGTLNSWLIDVVNLLTGNLDSRGGAMFPEPAANLSGLMHLRGAAGEHAAWYSRVRSAPAFCGEQPTACLAEEIDTPGRGQIRAMLTLAGNPVLSAPDSGALDRAFEGLEFCAAVDFYVNETTRHAHIILPPTWSLEHDNYELLFHGFAVRNTAKYSAAVLAPAADSRHEWEIFCELGMRIREKKLTNPLTRALLRSARKAKAVPGPRCALDWMLRAGPHGDHFLPWRSGLRLRSLEETPSGLDLGPMEPCLERVINTPKGRIDLAHPLMLAELARLQADSRQAKRLGEGKEHAEPRDTREEPLLQLIGRRDLRSNNSWLHNAPVAIKGRNRCTLQMHPDDAVKRKLDPGVKVRVRSRAGELVTQLELSDRLRPGVVCLPHGWGHDKLGARLRVAEQHPGVNCNVLTESAELEAIVGNAIRNGVWVTVDPMVAE